MKMRNGIEGTQSELVRAHGLRRSRYRGKAKLDLQHQLIGAACNIKRWLRLMAWELKAKAAHVLEAVVCGNGGMPEQESANPQAKPATPEQVDCSKCIRVSATRHPARPLVPQPPIGGFGEHPTN